ncbi:MAG: ammonium transporter [Hormoscilla sp.]
MINILWLLLCSGLVFLMQPGFMCLESGLTRSKNSINVAVKNLADFGISVALFWAFGYALMFGSSWAGWLGYEGFLTHIDSSPELAAFFLFQMMFCSTATTIVSGAVAERMKFSAYLLVSCLVSGLIYPMFGHWAWNGLSSGNLTGWLGSLGFVDAAGATVVHSIGGWVSLAVLLVVGPRHGRFPADGPVRKIQGSNLQLSVLGAMLLWLGWLGFNGGSTLALNDYVPGTIANTVLAGVGGMMAAGGISWYQRQVPEVESLINGSIAGLVSITASCQVVTTPEAFAIGAIGAAVMMSVSYWLERWQIDDAVDAVAVHAGAGVWGTIAVALFGNLQLLHSGLSRGDQLWVQLLSVAIAFIWAFGITYLLLSAIDRLFPLRVSAEAEAMGLNVSEHEAKTEIYDLFQVMDHQAATKDLSLRVPVEPFTEVGHIAARYNQVMDALSAAVTRTEVIIKTATDAIITFSQSTLEILTANPSASEIFGYSVSSLEGMYISQLLEWPTNNASERKLLLDKWLQSGRHEVVGLRADGKNVTLEITVTEGMVDERAFYTGMFRDISDRKRAEEALQQAADVLQTSLEFQDKNRQLESTLSELKKAQSQLIHSEKMSSLGQLVAGVAHEINNPVNFIFGNLTYAWEYTQELLEVVNIYRQQYPEPTVAIEEKIAIDELDFMIEDLPKLIDSMKVGADRIREIVKSLRTFSRLDEAELKQVDLHVGIESTLMILQNNIKGKLGKRSVEVFKEYGNLPLVECYAGQLNQVFMNILSNAIDALQMEKPEPTGNCQAPKYCKIPKIWIKTEVKDSDRVRIRIQDNGPGMTDEVMRKLFDPFFTTKPVGKGTGLGLSISYQIVVDKHGGKMICNSAPGEGAEFLIEIPVRQVRDPVEEKSKTCQYAEQPD